MSLHQPLSQLNQADQPKRLPSRPGGQWGGGGPRVQRRSTATPSAGSDEHGPPATTHQPERPPSTGPGASSHRGADEPSWAAWGSGEGLCSSKVQQRHRANPTTANPRGPTGLRHRPPATALPPDGKEKVYGSIP
jgi:hypothetical protein